MWYMLGPIASAGRVWVGNLSFAGEGGRRELWVTRFLGQKPMLLCPNSGDSSRIQQQIWVRRKDRRRECSRGGCKVAHAREIPGEKRERERERECVCVCSQDSSDDG
jgi:hypothetical protein